MEGASLPNYWKNPESQKSTMVCTRLSQAPAWDTGKWAVEHMTFANKQPKPKNRKQKECEDRH